MCIRDRGTSHIFSVVLSVLDKLARLVKLITSGLSDIFPFPAFLHKLWYIQNARMVVDSKVDTPVSYTHLAAKQSYKKLDYKAVKSECDGRPFSFAYPLAPYGVAVFKY